MCYLKHSAEVYLFWVFPAAYAILHFFDKQLHLNYDEANQGYIDTQKNYIKNLEELVHMHGDQSKTKDQLLEQFSLENLALKEMLANSVKTDSNKNS